MLYHIVLGVACCGVVWCSIVYCGVVIVCIVVSLVKHGIEIVVRCAM